ncbi:MAG: lysylphosphatidylglycerol synthase domain-containing protein [Caulobacteraceae bacterium]
MFGESSAGDAAAATIVDVAIEALAQALYTLVAFLLLLPHLDGAEARRWGLIVAVGTVPILLMFAISRHRGALRLGQKIGMQLAKIMGIEGGHFHLADAVHAIYQRGPRIGASLVLHLLGWGLGAVQIWIAARGMSQPLGFADAIALAGLVSAAPQRLFPGALVGRRAGGRLHPGGRRARHGSGGGHSPVVGAAGARRGGRRSGHIALVCRRRPAQPEGGDALSPVAVAAPELRAHWGVG